MGTCVYVGILEDGSEVAVKRMLSARCESTAGNEKEILDLINTKKSSHIISYRHFLTDSNFMYLIMNLCEETLGDHISCKDLKYVQENSRRMIQEILTGLAFLHSQGILHRDLKPSNILVDVEDRMRLADFGISRVLNKDESTVQTNAGGTEDWMPPEVIAKYKQGKGPVKKKSDVHAAGMIAYFILSKGEHPFGHPYERMTNIMKGDPVNLKNLNDPEARLFVSKLFSHKIDDRPHASEALSYPYINEGVSKRNDGTRAESNSEENKDYPVDTMSMYDPSERNVSEDYGPIDDGHYSLDYPNGVDIPSSENVGIDLVDLFPDVVRVVDFDPANVNWDDINPDDIVIPNC
jgi:serine/threonine protein kinase